jgi:Protein of unknown function (DUF5818)
MTTTIRGSAFITAIGLAVGLVAAGVLATGCAGDPAPPAGSSPSATGSAGQPGSSSGAAAVTVTGRVERVDVEGGCLVLRADSGRTFELAGGDPAVVAPGARVTITGTVRTDAATICQLGPVFDVTAARPA